ncbi:MAG: hypothetical protein KF690_04500 [Bacteroidetes bacterium]|nr:hypothetical protein [Bacteroidota bacterium]
MKHLVSALMLSVALWFPSLLLGKENTPGGPATPRPARQFRTSAACLPSTSVSQLDINNVRALIHNGGDMWWDLVGAARYEVPKVNDPALARHSLFAASLWIGGIDDSGLLRIAAQTYRQSGNDFWPGPLRITGGADTEQAICNKWDKHFRINKTEIDQFLANGTTTPAILNWPAINEDAGAGDFERFLAPFHDANNDMDYNPDDGDYPVVKIASCLEGDGTQKEIMPDQFIWWVINDKGDVHTETGGQAIGIEIQMTAFAFTTSNAVNDMTFYQQKVYNRSNLKLNDTYIGQWTDADLGWAFDDFGGADTLRGLAYVYNADNDDVPLTFGYGQQPPSVGIDFFQGPLADLNNGKDDDKDGLIDEEGERLQMTKFVYYNNDFTLLGNPSQPTHYYNYLTGRWKDSSPMVDDRDASITDGYLNSGDLPGTPTNFMFPDYPGTSSCQYVKYTSANPWGEAVNAVAQGQPADKRLLQSSGPFTLAAGAFNEIIIGAVWARDQANQYDVLQFGSLCKLLQADDIAQALFDACFDLLDGPDAPDLFVDEYDRELVLSWRYTNTSANNYYENYKERDPVLCQANPNNCVFEFEGYMVYQLKDGTVNSTELEDPAKARLVAQCDIKNGVTSIVNRDVLIIPGQTEPVITDKVMVEGSDRGLFRSVSITSDAFAEGADERVVNYRTYYFAIIAYSYNDTSADGRKFIRSNRNVLIKPGTPHKSEFKNFGTSLKGRYGDGPEITRITGRGNSGRFLRLAQATENALLTPPYSVAAPTYAGGFGPLNVKIVNPQEIKSRVYEVDIYRDSLIQMRPNYEFADSAIYSDFMVYDVTDAPARQLVYRAQYNADNMDLSAYEDRILNGREHLVINSFSATPERLGFSVAVNQSTYPGDTLDLPKSGFIDADIEHEDGTRQWLTGLPDQDNFPMYNWIRSGATPRDAATGSPDPDFLDYYGADIANNPANNLVKTLHFYDKNESYEAVLNGTWSPYIMAASFHTAKDIIAPRVKVFWHDGYTAKTFPGGYIPDFEMDPHEVVRLDSLPNVDVVITTDQSKWSRCVVVETSPSKNLGSGAWIMTAKWRNSMSLADINNCVSPTAPSPGATDYGMSYFPGYAIDVDSGRRLNILFGESTWHKADNGDDMLFNPTSSLGNDGKTVGGRHYLYVSNTTYDGCATLATHLRVPPSATLPGLGTELANRPLRFNTGSGMADIREAWKTMTWTTIPLAASSQLSFKCYNGIPSNVRISLRVAQEMQKGARFRFDMRPYAALFNQQDVAKDALSIIRVVPNPFYGKSGATRGRYETSQLDTRVKITNLPTKCTIRIFTLNGALVRTFRKDSNEPDQEWDLKNDYGVPIASGLYILHIDAGDVGEKILKFFCVMPQPDLNAY